ncbi:MAG: Holliday junction resolvase RuvX [Candidatus Eisenbacteria bacterium]|nr:Holliday junction resolvase RuvX [Candidatus Latescibacterota bacterium]MBD3301763.1 Holliday junction resolvase RuvX [Candidatus Eisenbacteria bacterium]
MEPLDDLRLLAVDYGRRRTGLALSDPEGRLASPIGTLTCRGLDDLAARVAERAAEVEAGGVVIGFPRHLDGRPGDLAPEVQGLAERLRSRGLRTILWDERLTSWEAETKLREAGRSIRGTRMRVDAAAAAILLQSYLDSLRTG